MRFFFLLFFAAGAFGADLSPFNIAIGRILTPETGLTVDDEIDTLLNQRQAMVASFAPNVKNAGAQPPAQQLPELARIADRYRRLRNDTQTGASSSSAGSTSLVLNPYLADILGISLESGAILKTVSGNTINLQIKPAGLFCATKFGDATRALPGVPDNAACLEFWKRVGITAAFDKSRSNAPSQLVALQDDFSEFRVRFDLLAPQLKKARQALLAKMEQQGAAATTIGCLFSELSGCEKPNPQLITWTERTKTALKSAAAKPEAVRKAELEKTFGTALDQLQKLFETEPDLKAHMAPLILPFGKSYAESNLLALKVDELGRTSFSVEYSLNRPDVAKADLANGIVTKGQRPPDLSTARAIYARNYQPFVFTANGEASWFNETLPGMNGAFRSWQVSAMGTFLLKEIPNMGKTTLSFGGLIGDLHQQPLGFDYTVPLVNDPTKSVAINLTGPVRAFNARLEFPTANKSVTIPISFTYSNRTDLQKEADVRGSIGITVRFDSFFPTATPAR